MFTTKTPAPPAGGVASIAIPLPDLRPGYPPPYSHGTGREASARASIMTGLAMYTLDALFLRGTSRRSLLTTGFICAQIPEALPTCA